MLLLAVFEPESTVQKGLNELLRVLLPAIPFIGCTLLVILVILGVIYVCEYHGLKSIANGLKALIAIIFIFAAWALSGLFIILLALILFWGLVITIFSIIPMLLTNSIFSLLKLDPENDKIVQALFIFSVLLLIAIELYPYYYYDLDWISTAWLKYIDFISFP